MICAYKEDIEKSGGFDKSQKTWGGEDKEFAYHVLNNRSLKLIRYLC